MVHASRCDGWSPPRRRRSSSATTKPLWSADRVVLPLVHDDTESVPKSWKARGSAPFGCLFVASVGCFCPKCSKAHAAHGRAGFVYSRDDMIAVQETSSLGATGPDPDNKRSWPKGGPACPGMLSAVHPGSTIIQSWRPLPTVATTPVGIVGSVRCLERMLFDLARRRLYLSTSERRSAWTT
jgi:hypothetical protein